MQRQEARITPAVKSTQGDSLQRTEDSRSTFSPFYSKRYFTNEQFTTPIMCDM